MADRLILDTGLIIAAERDQADLRKFIGDGDPAIAAVTAMELLVGVAQASPVHRDLMALNVEGLLARMTIEMFTVDVARMHAILFSHARRIGRPRSTFDLMIAATAGATGRTLVTADAKACFDQLPGVKTRVVGVG